MATPLAMSYIQEEGTEGSSMQRLVLAIIIVAALVAGVALVTAALRRTLAEADALPATGNEGVRMIAYALLLGLIVYVSFAGAS